MFFSKILFLVGILILNLFVYKYKNIQHSAETITYKFIIGMCFAFISMCITGIVEVFRQKKCDTSRVLNK